MRLACVAAAMIVALALAVAAAKTSSSGGDASFYPCPSQPSVTTIVPRPRCPYFLSAGISEGARNLFTIGCGEGEESSNEPWQHGAMKWFGGPAHMRVEDYAVLQPWFRCDFSKRTLSLLAL